MKSSYASAQTEKPPNCRIQNNQLLARVTGISIVYLWTKTLKTLALGFRCTLLQANGRSNSRKDKFGVFLTSPSPFCMESQHPPLKQKQIASQPPPPQNLRTFKMISFCTQLCQQCPDYGNLPVVLRRASYTWGCFYSRPEVFNKFNLLFQHWRVVCIFLLWFFVLIFPTLPLAILVVMCEIVFH